MSADGSHGLAYGDLTDAERADLRARVSADAAEQAPVWMQCEQAVLGALMVHQGSLHTHAAGLEVEDFRDDWHQTIFRAVLSCETAGRVATPIALLRYMPTMEEVREFRRYLTAIIADAPILPCLRDYVADLKYHRFRREVAQTNRDLADKAEQAGPDSEPAKLLDEQIARLMALMPGRESSEPDIRAHIFGSKGARGLRTGFAAVDDLIAPLLPGQLVIVGARKKVGKSPIMLRIADDLATQGIPVGFVTLELSVEQMEERYLCALSDVDLRTIQEKSWNPTEGKRIEDAWITRTGRPLHIVGTGKWTTAKLRAKCTELVRLKGCKALFVDQLSWLTVLGKSRDKFDQLGQAVGDVKSIAQDLGVPVVLASQLNRGAEPEAYTGPGSVRRPSSQHLYGADEIAQTADVVLLVHRPEKMLGQIKPPEGAEWRGKALLPQWETERLRWEGRAELIATDRRSGPDGVREIAFIAPRMWFGPLHAGRLVHGQEDLL
jgi:replicative DNA helicase